jgi:hypothetical protein
MPGGKPGCLEPFPVKSGTASGQVGSSPWLSPENATGANGGKTRVPGGKQRCLEPKSLKPFNDLFFLFVAAPGKSFL